MVGGKEWRYSDVVIKPDYRSKVLNINHHSYPLFDKQNFYSDKLLHYRNFDKDGINEFYDFFKDELNVIIKERLYQIISYNQSGLKWINQEEG